jgi:hypothetical protein
LRIKQKKSDSSLRKVRGFGMTIKKEIFLGGSHDDCTEQREIAEAGGAVAGAECEKDIEAR